MQSERRWKDYSRATVTAGSSASSRPSTGGPIGPAHMHAGRHPHTRASVCTPLPFGINSTFVHTSPASHSALARSTAHRWRTRKGAARRGYPPAHTRAPRDSTHQDILRDGSIGVWGVGDCALASLVLPTHSSRFAWETAGLGPSTASCSQ